MNTSTIAPLTTLPKNLHLDGAIAITLQDGVLIFCASQNVQKRIEIRIAIGITDRRSH